MKSFFSTLMGLLFVVHFASATVCIGIAQYTDPLDNSTNHILMTYSANSDYIAPPFNIWNSQLVTLKWDQAYGANLITGMTNQAAFGFSLDGAAVLSGGFYYQKISSSSSNITQNIGTGNTVNVLIIDLSTAGGGTADIEIDPFPPIVGGNISANSAVGEQIDNTMPTCPGEASIPLPLELISFEASVQQASILLQWQSLNETNFDGYEIWRSEDGSDFSQLGWVKGGQKNGAYIFEDSKVQGGINYYYQLKMIDINGQFSHSPVRTAQLKGEAAFTLYPNPAQTEVVLNVQSEDRRAATIQLYDVSGKLLLTEQLSLSKGHQQHSLNLQAFPNGTYFLSFNNGLQIESRKIVVLH